MKEEKCVSMRIPPMEKQTSQPSKKGIYEKL